MLYIEADKANKPIHLDGPLVHWHELRPALLRSITEPLSINRFIGADAAQRLTRLSGSFITHLPQALHAWCQHSRRVYHVDEQLSHLLSLMSLRDISWRDVSWPFESFALSLDVPIRDDHGVEYDCLLISRETNHVNNKEVIGVRMISRDFEKVYMPTRDQRDNMYRMLSRKRLDQLAKLAIKRGKYYERAGRIDGACFYIYDDNLDAPVSASLESLLDTSEQTYVDTFSGRSPRKSQPHWQEAAKLLVNFCLYVRSLPKGSAHTSGWQKTARSTLDPLAISSGADVCTVTSLYTFTPQELELFRSVASGARTLIEMRVHFREGHWRRTPGTGHDPLAPFDVLVRPTIVRLDRLPSGALPGGTEKSFH
jgi:hypothetical protein